MIEPLYTLNHVIYRTNISIFCFCVVAILVHVKWFFIVILIYMPLMTNDVEQLVIRLLAICLYSFVSYMFFCPFLSIGDLFLILHDLKFQIYTIEYNNLYVTDTHQLCTIIFIILSHPTFYFCWRNWRQISNTMTFHAWILKYFTH